VHNITVVYKDGYEEKYLIPKQTATPENAASNFKNVIVDGMLKLIIENEQIVLIPFSSIRKIIYQPRDKSILKKSHYPGFVYVECDHSS